MNLRQLATDPHRRLNPLTKEWVLVSPHRNERPWQGQVESVPIEKQPAYDPNCYLCPGNMRAGGARNPQYEGTFAFNNDFAALKPETARFSIDESDLLVAQSESGRCRVVCFSPRHDLTIAQMRVPDIRRVVDAWIQEFQQLGDEPDTSAVQIFENRGAIMGCSNPHPHGQIWAGNYLPTLVAQEDACQKQYLESHGQLLLIECLEAELKRQVRVIDANPSWVAVVPHWATWPFELLLIPRRHVKRLPELTEQERRDLANVLKRILTRYDNLFETSFPY